MRTLGIMASVAALLGACTPWRGAAHGARAVDELAPVADQQTADREHRLLSAHHARARSEADGQPEALLLVYSVRVDPMGLQPDDFSVVSRSGRRVKPERALLAPADERDEHRSVLLLGDFGHDADDRPVHVGVRGLLHAVDGKSLRGLAATITAAELPDVVVAVEQLEPAAGRCHGFARVVRTYWSDVLREVEADDLELIELQQGNESGVHPAAFDDHRLAATTSSRPVAGPGEDNVLDLCMEQPGPVTRLRIGPGAFRDGDGHRTATVDFAIE